MTFEEMQNFSSYDKTKVLAKVLNENNFSVSYKDLNSLGDIYENQSTACEDNQTDVSIFYPTFIHTYSTVWGEQPSRPFVLPKKIKETFYKNFGCNIRLSTRFVNNKYELAVFQTNGDNKVLCTTTEKQHALKMHDMFESCASYLDDDDFLNSFLDLLAEGDL
jgi:hypothetical protein